MSHHQVFFIIDDDADDQSILMEALFEIDPTSQCFTAMNGQEGLQMLDKKEIPFPSLIFLDLNMPRINGQRFLAEIKQQDQFNKVPVVIFTTSNDQKDMDDTKGLGAVGYIIKPTDFTKLKDELQMLLCTILPENSHAAMAK